MLAVINDTIEINDKSFQSIKNSKLYCEEFNSIILNFIIIKFDENINDKIEKIILIQKNIILDCWGKII